MSDSKYSIWAFSTYAVEKEHGDVRWLADRQGYDAEREADNLKEAKRLAKYLLSEDYRRSGEMSERLAYAQVILNSNEDCVHDEWREGYELPKFEEAEP